MNYIRIQRRVHKQNRLHAAARRCLFNLITFELYVSPTWKCRRAVRRKANLEVTDEEKPKTRLRRRKANKRLCREKKPVCALPDEEKSVSLVSDEKRPVCAVPGRKITTNGILRVKTLIKNISEITRDTNYIWICAGGYCGTTLHQFCRYV